MLASTSLPYNEPDSQGYLIEDMFRECAADMSGLIPDLEKLAADVDPVEERIKKQMDLSQSFWTTVLGFLVAIYVPISFASVSCPKILNQLHPI